MTSLRRLTQKFLASDHSFVVERGKEKLYVTFNTGGY